jgi:small-conductance mechanosensitive channel
VVYELISIFINIVDYVVEKFSFRKDESSKAAYFAIGKVLKWSVWLGAGLFVLSNYGVDVTALATGLGIGGIAIAFALQGVLKDLFSYFTILLDKPIRIGDYIDIDGKKGKVEDIGLKTTRLVAVDGQEIVVANDLITSGTLDNHGKAKDRRVNVQYGVSYDTDVKTLKKLKKEIIKIIEKFDDVEFHRCHLRNLADSSMDYDIVYHIKTRDYNLYMDINEEINFKILELFEKNKVEIPYPTQTIYTRKG